MENVSRLLQRHQSPMNSTDPIINAEDHDRVLSTCIDIPEQTPSFPITIDEVGINNKTVWVQLPQGRIPFDAEITVDLPGTARGIHMSRMEGVISKLFHEVFDDIGAYSEALARGIAEEQSGKSATVRLHGKLPSIQTTVASSRQSIDTITVTTESVFTKSRSACPVCTTVSVALDHITACPCTQAYNQVLFHAPASRLQPTHSQRSTTELAITRTGKHPSIPDMIECLQSALHTTSDLLKRTDEAEIVLKSHNAPQFAEDTTRETAWAVGRILGDQLPPDTTVCISSLSLESIHTHNVTCRLTTTIEEIMSVMHRRRE